MQVPNLQSQGPNLWCLRLGLCLRGWGCATGAAAAPRAVSSVGAAAAVAVVPVGVAPPQSASISGLRKINVVWDQCSLQSARMSSEEVSDEGPSAYGCDGL